MSSNFEEAYKAEVQQNIPDLWNRIESSLPQKKKNSYAWMKWTTLAAAAVLVMILLPTLSGIGVLYLLSDKGISADMAVNETAADEMIMMDTTLKEEDTMESNNTGVKEEVPVFADEVAENQWEETAGAENLTQSTAESEGNTDFEYRILLAGGVTARVIECEADSEDSSSYSLWLELPEEARAVFENRDEFYEERLKVSFCCDNGELPKEAEYYTFNIYEAGSEKRLVAELME